MSLALFSSWEAPWLHPGHYITQSPTFSLDVARKQVADKDSKHLLYF